MGAEAYQVRTRRRRRKCVSFVFLLCASFSSFYFLHRVSQCSFGRPGAHCLDQGALEPPDMSAFAFLVLG